MILKQQVASLDEDDIDECFDSRLNELRINKQFSFKLLHFRRRNQSHLSSESLPTRASSSKNILLLFGKGKQLVNHEYTEIQWHFRLCQSKTELQDRFAEHKFVSHRLNWRNIKQICVQALDVTATGRNFRLNSRRFIQIVFKFKDALHKDTKCSPNISKKKQMASVFKSTGQRQVT